MAVARPVIETIPGVLAAAADGTPTVSGCEPMTVRRPSPMPPGTWQPWPERAARHRDRARRSRHRHGPDDPAVPAVLVGAGQLGAVTVPTDPAGTAVELAGLVAPGRARGRCVSDAGLWANCDEAGVDRAPRAGRRRARRRTSGATPAATARLERGRRPDDLAVLIPTSGTTGRSKLVMQTHRAYAWAGVGFPYWMELRCPGPAADLVAAVPHQRAGVLGAGFARLWRRTGPAAPLLGQRLPRRGAAPRRDRVRRDRGDAGNPYAPTGPARRRGQPVAAVLHRPSPAREWQEAFERRFGLRVVCGYAMSESPYGLIWRHGTRPFGTLGSVRRPHARHVERGPGG